MSIICCIFAVYIKNMGENTKKIEEPKIEVVKPIKIQLRFKGNPPFTIKWFDNTEKKVGLNEAIYIEYNIQTVLQQLNLLYQLNPNMILKTSINTIQLYNIKNCVNWRVDKEFRYQCGHLKGEQ